MVRFWTAVAMAFLVGACGDSASESQKNSSTPDQTGSSRPLPADTTEAGLYGRAQSAEQQGRVVEAVGLYREILERYPQSPDQYKAVFLIGFVFSEKLNQPDSARVMFKTVIRDYPDCEFVDDAEAMLRFLDGELPPFEDAPHS